MKKLKIFYFTIILFLYFNSICFSTLYKDLSELEKKNVDIALLKLGFIADNNPENKSIDDVTIFTFAPFLEDEKVLYWTNRFHINTKDHIIKQDILVKPGQDYSANNILSSEINLRQNGIRSIAVIIPVYKIGEASDSKVSLLVVTKDTFSFGFSSSFDYSAENLNRLAIALGENNLFGLNQSIYALYNLNQTAHEGYIKYYYPKIFHTNWSMTLKPGLIFLRKDFSYDGFAISATVKKPIESSSNMWGISASASMESKTIEKFKGNEVDTFVIADSKKNFPKRYRNKNFHSQILAKKGLGQSYKHEHQLFMGHGLNIKMPTLEKSVGLNEADTKLFEEQVLPRKEKESFALFGYKYYQNIFLTIYDYETLSLQENKRLGPYFKISSDFSSKLFLSDHNFVRPQISISQTFSFLNDGFIEGSALVQTRYDKNFLDNTLSTAFIIVSPKIFNLFRLHEHASLKAVQKSRDNLSVSLGSNNGLRGVESNFYSGDKSLKINLELRSKGFDVKYFFAGINAFYDAGSAFKEFKKLDLTHTVGLGARVLFPQFSSEVLRFDCGFVVHGPSKKHRLMVISFGTGQAF